MNVDVTGFSYNPITGKFYNRFSHEIGSYTRKYGRTYIDGKQVSLSRLAVKIMTGKWPSDQVDHIDGNPHNNCWINLRECSRNQNMKNRKVYDNNITGFKGVYFQKYKQRISYLSSIQVDNKRIFLGTFKTPEEAARAYDAAAIIHHKEFSNLNFKELQSVS